MKHYTKITTVHVLFCRIIILFPCSSAALLVSLSLLPLCHMSSGGSFVHDPPLHCVSRRLLVCYNCTCLLLFTNSAMCVTTSPPPTCICFYFSSLCCNEECFPLTFILYSYYYYIILLLTLCMQCTVIMLCITVTDENVRGGNFV